MGYLGKGGEGGGGVGVPGRGGGVWIYFEQLLNGSRSCVFIECDCLRRRTPICIR